MKMRNLVAMFAVGAFAAAAWALCPPDKDGADQKATQPKVELTTGKSGGCSKSKDVQTAATTSSGCNKAKAVQTTSEKPGCCAKKAAQTASAKSNGCAKAKAVQTAGTKSGCCSKSVQTATTKSGCCSKSVQTASTGSGCSKSAGTARTASTGSGCNKPCTTTQTASAGSGCPKSAKIQTVLASLPTMTYKVGDNTTCCDKAATVLAKDSGAKIQYVVGEQTFDEQGEAVVQLAKLLEDKAAEMQTIQFSAGSDCYRCPMTAKAKAKDGKIAYRVGGVDFENKAQAEKALEQIKVALAKVELNYKVGDKSYKCGASAGKDAEKAGGELTYVVGDQETGCKVQAGMLLAQTKVRTIVETAVQTL